MAIGSGVGANSGNVNGAGGGINALDMTTRIQGIESERDAMLSFSAFILFPLIKIHSSFILKEFRMEQSQVALAKQATNASKLLKDLMVEKEEKSKKEKAQKKSNQDSKDSKENKENELSEKEQLLQDQIDALKAKLEISNSQRNDFKQELDLMKEKVKQLDLMDKVVKKKT